MENKIGINYGKREDIEMFYVKKHNDLYWLCHQHKGEVDMLSHCISVSKEFYEAFIKEQQLQK